MVCANANLRDVQLLNENTYDALEGRFLWVNKKKRELICNAGLKRIFHGYTSTVMQIVNPADKHYLKNRQLS